MSNITIKISFIPSLAKLSKKFGNIKINGFLKEEIKKLAFLIGKESKKVTPVDTGLLRASIRTLPMVRPLEAVIQPHTHYAIFVHEGTRFMKGRPFMKWGAETSVKGYDRQMARSLERFIQTKIK